MTTTFGFDPGGIDAFGLAVICDGELRTATCSSVGEALAWVDKVPLTRQDSLSAGIDSLLHWSLAKGGWRAADKHLRSAYPESRPSIMSPNRLSGSMAIGGMALAYRLRQVWPDMLINETHPKVLYFWLTERRYDRVLDEAKSALGAKLGLDLAQVANEHELDAALSAWATFEGQRSNWTDMAERDELHIFPISDAKFLWPPGLRFNPAP